MVTPSSIDNDTSLPLETVGPYTLLSKIGSGGMGSVYLARHIHLDRLVAVKMLPPRGEHRPATVERFKQEMAAIGRLKHPNIIAATDAGVDRGCHYLVMEYVEGADLGRLLREHGPFALADACELARQTAVALECIRANGLVHRDIKPSNLLLGADGIVRVLDLGLARFEDPSSGRQPLTESGVVMGTGDFIAPEQGTGSHPADIRADIYGLGCTLYALLAGKPPFSGPAYNSFFKKVQAHQFATIPPLTSLRPEVPPGLASLLDRMLAKDPEQRIGSPAEVARLLAAFTAGQAVENLLQTPSRGEWDSLLHGSSSPPATVAERRASATADAAPAPAAQTLSLPRPAPRRHRRVVLGIGVTLAVAGLVLSWLVVHRLYNPAAPPGRSGPVGQGEPAPEPPPAGVWQDLLKKPPRQIQFPNRVPAARIDHVPEKGQLWVNSTGRALLELTAVEALGFDLEMTVSQNPWVGGFGVFFRGRDHDSKPTDFTSSIWSDLLYLQRFRHGKEGAPVRLVRGHLLRPDPKKSPFPDSIIVTEIPYPNRREHRLAITVDARGLKTITWDQKPVALKLPDPNPEITPREGAHGTVGLFIEDCNVAFRSVRLRYHTFERKKP